MNIYNISDFGAAGDGVSDDTPSLRRAVAECRKSGGGRIVVDGGKVYRCGAVELCDNAELFIARGTTLKASDNLEDYDLGSRSQLKLVNGPTWNNCDYSGRPTKFFLYAKDCNNISLRGEGVIDGNDSIFFGRTSKYHIEGKFYPRIPLIFFENCKNVSIANITIQKSGFWTVHLVGCDGVNIEGVSIFNNLRLACCDGIDPDHCKNVTIKNCHIEAADDCIVFKTTAGAKEYGACEHIKVEGCRLVSTSAAIKFGSESVSDFNDIEVSDCVIERSNRGISFQLRDGGSARNIRFKNISISTRRFSPVEWWGKAEPVVITSLRRNSSSACGVADGVEFRNIKMDCENGIFIYSEFPRGVRNVTFTDCSLSLADKTPWQKDTHDIRPCEGEGILKQPMNAVFAKNAENIVFCNFSRQAEKEMSEQMGEWLYSENSSVIFRKD